MNTPVDPPEKKARKPRIPKNANIEVENKPIESSPGMIDGAKPPNSGTMSNTNASDKPVERRRRTTTQKALQDHVKKSSLVNQNPWYKNTKSIIKLVKMLIVLGMSSIAFYKLLPFHEVTNENIEFIVDTSKSLNDSKDGSTKFEAIIQSLNSALKQESNKDNLALRTFGGSCDGASTALQVPFDVNNKDKILSTLRRTKPSGVRPFYQGIIEATGDFNEKYIRDGKIKKIIVITTGLDECPDHSFDIFQINANMQARLAAANISAEIFIVGFNVSNEQRKHLEAIGSVLGGRTTFPNSKQEMANVITQIKKNSLKIKDSTKAIDIGSPNENPENKASVVDPVKPVLDEKAEIENITTERQDVKVNRIAQIFSRSGLDDNCYTSNIVDKKIVKILKIIRQHNKPGDGYLLPDELRELEAAVTFQDGDGHLDEFLLANFRASSHHIKEELISSYFAKYGISLTESEMDVVLARLGMNLRECGDLLFFNTGFAPDNDYAQFIKKNSEKGLNEKSKVNLNSRYFESKTLSPGFFYSQKLIQQRIIIEVANLIIAKNYRRDIGLGEIQNLIERNNKLSYLFDLMALRTWVFMSLNSNGIVIHMENNNLPQLDWYLEIYKARAKLGVPGAAFEATEIVRRNIPNTLTDWEKEFLHYYSMEDYFFDNFEKVNKLKNGRNIR